MMNRRDQNRRPDDMGRAKREDDYMQRVYYMINAFVQREFNNV